MLLGSIHTILAGFRLPLISSGEGLVYMLPVTETHPAVMVKKSMKMTFLVTAPESRSVFPRKPHVALSHSAFRRGCKTLLSFAFKAEKLFGC